MVDIATWEQRKLPEIVERQTSMSDNALLPNIEFEDIVAGSGKLNKDVSKKKTHKKGIAFRQGDILYGKLRPYLNNWLLGEFSGLAIGDFWVLRPILFNSPFTYALIQSPTFQAAANVTSGTKMPRSSWSNVSGTNYLVPLAKNEAAAIGKLFSNLGSTIALHERKLDLLKRLKVAYQQQLFPEKGAQLPHLRFSGFTAGWEQRTLTEHITSSLGGGTPSTSIAKYWEGNLPWIQSSDLAQDDLHSYRINKHISESAVKETAAKHIPANSMAVVVRVGVGKVVIPETDYSTSQDFISLVGLKGDKDFLLYAIHRLLKRLAINTQGTSIKGITKSNLIESKVLSPKDKREQVLIGQLLSKIDTCIAIHQRELDRLRELKMAYIQKLFA